MQFLNTKDQINCHLTRGLLETKTMGLEMGICSFSFTGAILP
jgi:hypothetical protein